jgi:Reverse transcriptase (RNA-dependent DNA polymerase)
MSMYGHGLMIPTHGELHGANRICHMCMLRYTKRKIIVRLLANIYTHNLVRVTWGGALSDYFSAINGVKQGAVLSPVLFCIYVDDLLLLLSKAGVGCYIGPNFVGALAYADDIVLIAPTPTALRRLLVICESYARDFCISFNSLKTKCMIFIPKERRDISAHVENLEFFIDDKPISFVKSFFHLGHLIKSDLSDDDDIVYR